MNDQQPAGLGGGQVHRRPEVPGHEAGQVAHRGAHESPHCFVAGGQGMGAAVDAGVEAGEVLKEFRVAADVAAGLKPGATLPVTTFAVG
ncbi:MAG: hypothetical protein J0M16_10995, partial [Gammaproteobacteria bacterium]|nr:hypothetical protein [Gammaproteobacteria bacterium]